MAPGSFGRMFVGNRLALWFAGLSALGYLRFWMKAVRSGAGLDAVAWAWLAGSILLTLLAIGLWVADARNSRGHRTL